MAKRSQRLRRKKRIERMKAREQEQKMTKVVEDNSVILERMKNMSSSCDKILQTFDTTTEEITNTETTNASKIEPQFMSTEPVPQIKDYKKMLKKQLLTLAEELGCSIKPSMTKANIIKAIEAKEQI